MGTPLDFTRDKVEYISQKEQYRRLHEKIMVLHEKGYSAQGISEELGIARSTISKHLRRERSMKRLY